MRILVVRTDFLGDSVLSSTFIRMLKQLPDVQIDILCYEYNFAAFLYNKHIDNKYRLYKIPASSEEKLNNHQVLQSLGQNKYTAVFMLNRDFKTYKLLKYINSPRVFGHRLGVKSLRSKMFCRFTSLSFKYNYLEYDNSIHEVINQFNLLKFGLHLLNIPNNITLDKSSYFYTESFDPEEHHQKDTETIVVNISGRRDTVRYIPSSLAQVIIAGLVKLGKKVLVIATKDEFIRANEVLSQFDIVDVSLCADGDLFNIANTMAKYKYYIGADGGLLHIAAGLKMHCIGLFHAQNVEAWHPWSIHQICVQTPTKKIYDLTADNVIKAFKSLELNHE